MKIAAATTALLLLAQPALAQTPPERQYRLEEVGATEIPLEKSEGYETAQKLNASVAEANNAAAAREVAARNSWQAQEVAKQAAYQASLARHNAEVAAVQQQIAAIDAQDRAAAADFQAQNLAYQAQLETARQAQAAYALARADYDACIAGDQVRCHR